jgi:hydroxymethylglutaryl-CoA synthase
MIGIVSYGTYIPKFRLTTAEVAEAWRKDAAEVLAGLAVSEKSVPAPDEDAVTIAFEAASLALARGGMKPEAIEALFVGSESHPYAVNPTSTIVGEFLGVGTKYLAADFEFACKAGSAGMQAIAGLLGAGQIRLGLAIGTDTAQSRPHDVLEYTSAAAGAAFLLGTRGVVAELVSYTSYSSDTPDFWRRDGMRYPSHAGRFTGEPAYFAHVAGAAAMLMEKAKITPQDVDYCVFHMPNGKFPRAVAKRLGFTQKQQHALLVVDGIGNPYSASSLLGLAATLDVAKPGQKIFMISYGSGAGSDAFLWKVTDKILAFQKSVRKDKHTVSAQIANRQYVNYVSYLKQTHKI